MSAILASGQGESAFGRVEPWGIGVRYNTDDPSMPPSVDIYAAGIPAPPTQIYFAPGQLYAIIERFPTVEHPVSTPEPGSLYLLAIGLFVAVLGKRLAKA